MLWVLKTYVKTDGKENIHNFTLKKYVYLNLLSISTLCLLDYYLCTFREQRSYVHNVTWLHHRETWEEFICETMNQLLVIT